jgi:hypothetical protein
VSDSVVVSSSLASSYVMVDRDKRTAKPADELGTQASDVIKFEGSGEEIAYSQSVRAGHIPRLMEMNQFLPFPTRS